MWTLGFWYGRGFVQAAPGLAGLSGTGRHSIRETMPNETLAERRVPPTASPSFETSTL